MKAYDTGHNPKEDSLVTQKDANSFILELSNIPLVVLLQKKKKIQVGNMMATCKSGQ